ncbi:MAG TPA: carboxylesterase/lipase family protein [Candidatus Dormibacteraeota bacterium]
MSISIDPIVVETRTGEVRGRQSEGVVAFKGIPYAAPPFGPNRFRPPVPHARWEGVLDALGYGPTVPKPPYFPPFDVLLPEPAIPGEDCLNLNIWTPDPQATGLPVLVWIHGGAFANGSGAVPTYDGTRFARDGVVAVTINYRLGVDGFLFLDDGISNLGLLDQIAALEWVRDNIAAFGGDAGKVTIAGESAGAMSVTTLMAMPRARGLFKRVIAESGAGHHALTSATAAKVGRYLAEKVGVPATREAIAAAPVEKVYEAQVALSAEAFMEPNPAKWGEVALNLMPFEPVIDGDTLPKLPIDLIREGAGRDLDLLVGTNRDEENLFLVPNGMIGAIDENLLGMVALGYQMPADALGEYRRNRPGASPGELMSAVATDWFFRIPALRLAEVQAAGTGANHVYEFCWRSPQFGGKLGACHALEIAFAFDNLDREGGEPLAGEEPPQELADEMHAAWVSFIATGDPGWDRYDPATRKVRRFGGEPTVVADPAGSERALWEGIR